jgi:hypothetical protein
MVLLLACAAFLTADAPRGRVVDAASGEPLARVAIELAGTGIRVVTGADGRFELPQAPEGEHTLVATTVGYRAARVELSFPAVSEIEIRLLPEMLRRTETLDVSAGAFGAEAPLALDLAGGELKNLSGVLADDPVRAVQAMPGVTSNDDFSSQFAIRGAGFLRLGLYLDGILLHAPFHSVQGERASGSLTSVQGDVLESLSLHSTAPPAALGDRTAGALDLRMREGNRDRLLHRASVSASNATWFSEGPLASGKRGSWLAGVRKSYLQYLLSSTSDEPAVAFGFTDVQGRATYALNRRHQLSLAGLYGYSALDRTEGIPRFGANTIVTSSYHSTFGHLALRSTLGGSFIWTNRVAYLRDRYVNRNRDLNSLGNSGYGEWVLQSEASCGLRNAGLLEWGFNYRRLRDDGSINRYTLVPATARRIDSYRGSAGRPSGYLNASRSFASGKLTLLSAARWDYHTTVRRHIASPQAALAWQPLAATRFTLHWGLAAQYPEILQLHSGAGGRWLLPERSQHAAAAIEQRLGSRTRLRAEVYQRNDRDLMFRQQFEPRVLNGRITGAAALPPWTNSQRGYARGWMVLLQSRTSNNLSGWVAYAYGAARLRDGVMRLSFPSDYDQRHAVHTYASYRVRPTVNLSLRYVFGTGLPVPGFFRGNTTALYLASERNQVRLPDYHRADLRINRSFERGRWRMTLYGELINITNHRNLRADEIAGYAATTGQVRYNFDRMFPILPLGGISFEF